MKVSAANLDDGVMPAIYVIVSSRNEALWLPSAIKVDIAAVIQKNCI